MATINQLGPVLRVPEREIPVPTTVSAEAQGTLSRGRVVEPTRWPGVDDLEAWRALITVREGEHRRALFSRAVDLTDTRAAPEGTATKTEQREVAGTTVYVVTPPTTEPSDRGVYLELHGGGFIHYGGDLCQAMAIGTAERIRATVWSVDYRLAPDHPYPAALDDAVRIYRALLGERQPEEVVIGGPSAGGTLAAATVLRARDEGLPLPAAAVMESPAVDLTGSGDTWSTNMGLDNVITESYLPVFTLYAGGADLHDPYVSPLFGDFTKGFPPTVLTSGTRDILLSDTVRMHRALRRAGVDAELHIWEAAAHAKFLGTAPEDLEHAQEIHRFLERHWCRQG
jgi:acetyl esterase/lipase